ncbi:hypothetical protein [Secundilactobacillus odoratitofui]|nr:hypothetical protein [Secundilactobacillus odoratitofui]
MKLIKLGLSALTLTLGLSLFGSPAMASSGNSYASQRLRLSQAR